ncbi:C-terminal processing peptidase-3 [Fodinibius salinus]|uniref:C-terminal processing peptidase-3 n=1 Tax=Fodinibius salinus TaxID=860790 RepID=A0A5D3YGN7_9BACT|nr:S41 family peptidase [Fodinibius salinus]TYP92591.1 C-terminal processing peptidase-3 [Fodinibius salinus]
MAKWKKILAGAILGITSLVLVGFARNPDIYFLIKKNFTIFSEVYREVSLHYVDKVNPEKLMRRGIDAMLESLDPYTVLVDEAETQRMEIITRGSYGGVGLDVGFRGDKIVVVAPIEGYAAYNKGIRSGDIITKVDGVPVGEMNPDEVQNLMAGEPGSSVTLTVERYGIDHPLSFKLQRERVEVKNITYSGFVGDNKQVGYILLKRFARQAGQEIRHALQNLRSQKQLEGVILDLRNNPGGLLEEAVSTVDTFVPKGQLVVETRGRNNRHDKRFETQQQAPADKLPLIILQNGGSASASEIVSGALQDLDRAVIIGEQSFGKGLVQTVRPLSYNTVLKLTSSRYYIPSGRSIQSVTYTHKGKNTPVEKADSAQKEFMTQAGRTVYDGDGIAPDINISASNTTLLQTSLMRQNMFFNFANKYAAEHDSLDKTMHNDQVYDDFKSFLNRQEFEYGHPSEEYLAKIDSSLNGGIDESDKHIKALRKQIEQQKAQSFDEQRMAIQKQLYLELVARYKGREGQRAASLPYDPLVTKAVEILNDSVKYNQILSVE